MLNQKGGKTMNERLGKMEEKFANIIWEKEPIPSGELVKICLNELDWKKSTTYTMLKRLCKRGIFKNENSIVRALISKDDYLSEQSKNFIDKSFNGSLPLFIAAFANRNKLSEKEIAEIKAFINNYER